MAGETRVVVEGAKEASAAMRRLPSELNKEIRTEVRVIVKDVAARIKAEAEKQGLRDSGDLIKGIKPSVSRVGGKVESTARRAGYPYPNIYEFARGRAFFYPAVEASKAKAVARMEKAAQRAIEASRLS